MAIHKRMPNFAALADSRLVEAIEMERKITEKVVLSVIWGFQ